MTIVFVGEEMEEDPIAIQKMERASRRELELALPRRRGGPHQRKNKYGAKERKGNKVDPRKY